MDGWWKDGLLAVFLDGCMDLWIDWKDGWMDE